MTLTEMGVQPGIALNWHPASPAADNHNCRTALLLVKSGRQKNAENQLDWTFTVWSLKKSDQASWHLCWLPVLAASLWTVIQTDGSWQWKLPSYCLNVNFCKVLTKFYNFVKWRAGSERSSSKWYLDISYNPRRTIFPTSKDGINSRGN